MGLNTVIAELSIQMLNKHDSSLYDAIVEGDLTTIKWLVNNKYKMDVLNMGFVRESVSIAKMIQAMEVILDSKRIRLIC